MSTRNAQVMAASALLIGLIALGIVLVNVDITSGGGSGGSGETASTTNCQAGYFTTSLNESSAGTLVISCSQVGWTQLTGYPSGCSAGQFVTAVGTTLTCSSPPGEAASSVQCATGQFVSNVTESSSGSLTIVCSLVNWSSLQNFPSGCSVGQFVTAVGSTLSCATPASDVSSSVKCGTAGQFLSNVTESAAGALTGICAFPDWTKLINFPAGCAAGQFVTGVGVALTCSSVAWSQITSFPSGCSAGSVVTAVGVTLTCNSTYVRNVCNPWSQNVFSVKCIDTNGNIWLITNDGICGPMKAVKLSASGTTQTTYTSASNMVPTVNTQFLANNTGVWAFALSASSGCSPSVNLKGSFFTFSTNTWSTQISYTSSVLSGYCYCMKVSWINATSWELDSVLSGNQINARIHNDGTGVDTSNLALGTYAIPSFSNISPQLVNQASKKAQTGTVASLVTWAVNQQNQTFRIDGDIDVSAFTSGTISLQATYTDWNNNAQTVTLITASALADAPANGVTIMVKSGTTITLKTTGTFIATYNVIGSIEWISLGAP